MNINITEQEHEIIARVIKDGSTITGIEKDETEFRVHITYAGGHAVGSHAVIYDLVANWNKNVRELKQLEKELGYGQAHR